MESKSNRPKYLFGKAYRLSYVDTTKWNAKHAAIMPALYKAAAAALMQDAQDIHNASDKMLSGPQITPGIPGSENEAIGGTPIPRRTGDLARSLQMKMNNILEWFVWSSGTIAKYNKFVHDGTKYMRPRRFITDPVRILRPKLLTRTSSKIMSAIRRVGRA